MEENRHQVVFAVDRDSFNFEDAQKTLPGCVIRVISALSQCLTSAPAPAPILEFGYRFFRSRHWKAQLKRYTFADFNLKVFKDFQEELTGVERGGGGGGGGGGNDASSFSIQPSRLSPASVYQILLKEIGHDFPWRRGETEGKRLPPKKRGAKREQTTKAVKNHLFLVGKAPSTEEEMTAFFGREESSSSRSRRDDDDDAFRSLFPPLVADLYVNQLSCAVCWIDLSAGTTLVAPSFSSLFPRVNGLLLGREKVDSPPHRVASYLHEALAEPGWKKRIATELKVGEGSFSSSVAVRLRNLASRVDAPESPVMRVKATVAFSALDPDRLRFSRSFLCDSDSAIFVATMKRLYRGSTMLLLEFDDDLAVLCPLKTNSALVVECRPSPRPPLEEALRRLERPPQRPEPPSDLPLRRSRMLDRLNDVSKPRTFLPLTPAQLAAKKRKFKRDEVEENASSSSSVTKNGRPFHRRSSSGMERSFKIVEEGRRKSKEGEDLAGKRKNSLNQGTSPAAQLQQQQQPASPSKEAKLRREELVRNRERLYGTHETDSAEIMGVKDEEELLTLLGETYRRVLEESWGLGGRRQVDQFDAESSGKILHAVQAIFDCGSRFFRLKGSGDGGDDDDDDERLTTFIRRHLLASRRDVRLNYEGKYDDVSLERKMREYEMQAVLRLELESWSPSFTGDGEDDEEEDSTAGQIVSFLRIRDPNFIKGFLKEFLMSNFLHLEADFLVAIFEELSQPIPDILSTLVVGKIKEPDSDDDSEDELAKRLQQWNEHGGGGGGGGVASFDDANPSISALLSLQGTSLNGSYFSNASDLSQGSTTTKSFARHGSLQQQGGSQRQIVVPAAQKKSEPAPSSSKRKPSNVKKLDADSSLSRRSHQLSQSCFGERTKSLAQPDSETKRVRRNLFEDDDDDGGGATEVGSSKLTSARKLGSSPGTTGSGRKGKRLNRTFHEGQQLTPQTPPKADHQKVLKDRTVTETPNHKQMPMQERLVLLRRRMIEKEGATHDQASSVLRGLVIEESPVKSLNFTSKIADVTPKDERLKKLRAKSRSSLSFAEDALLAERKREKESPATRASSLVRRRSFYTQNSDHKSRNFDKYLQSRDLADRIGGRKRLKFNEIPLATSSVADDDGVDSSVPLPPSFATRNLFASESPASSSSTSSAKALFRDSPACSSFAHVGSRNGATLSSLDDDVFFGGSKDSKIISANSLTFSLDIQKLSQSSDEGSADEGDRRNQNETPERSTTVVDGAFDKWPRIKPRFGAQHMKFGGGAHGVKGSGVAAVDQNSSPTKSKKRELSPPGSPDLFKTPSKRARVEPRDSLTSPPPPKSAQRVGLLWGTDHSPLKTTPKKTGLVGSSSPANSPMKGVGVFSPSKRLVGASSLSPHRGAGSPFAGSLMNAIVKTPTKSPSIASILHLVTSPLKGDKK